MDGSNVMDQMAAWRRNTKRILPSSSTPQTAMPQVASGPGKPPVDVAPPAPSLWGRFVGKLMPSADAEQAAIAAAQQRLDKARRRQTMPQTALYSKPIQQPPPKLTPWGFGAVLIGLAQKKIREFSATPEGLAVWSALIGFVMTYASQFYGYGLMVAAFGFVVMIRMIPRAIRAIFGVSKAYALITAIPLVVLLGLVVVILAFGVMYWDNIAFYLKFLLGCGQAALTWIYEHVPTMPGQGIDIDAFRERSAATSDVFALVKKTQDTIATSLNVFLRGLNVGSDAVSGAALVVAIVGTVVESTYPLAVDANESVMAFGNGSSSTPYRKAMCEVLEFINFTIAGKHWYDLHAFPGTYAGFGKSDGALSKESRLEVDKLQKWCGDGKDLLMSRLGDDGEELYHGRTRLEDFKTRSRLCRDFLAKMLADNVGTSVGDELVATNVRYGQIQQQLLHFGDTLAWITPSMHTLFTMENMMRACGGDMWRYDSSPVLKELQRIVSTNMQRGYNGTSSGVADVVVNGVYGAMDAALYMGVLGDFSRMGRFERWFRGGLANTVPVTMKAIFATVDGLRAPLGELSAADEALFEYVTRNSLSLSGGQRAVAMTMIRRLLLLHLYLNKGLKEFASDLGYLDECVGLENIGTRKTPLCTRRAPRSIVLMPPFVCRRVTDALANVGDNVAHSMGAFSAFTTQALFNANDATVAQQLQTQRVLADLTAAQVDNVRKQSDGSEFSADPGPYHPRDYLPPGEGRQLADAVFQKQQGLPQSSVGPGEDEVTDECAPFSAMSARIGDDEWHRQLIRTVLAAVS